MYCLVLYLLVLTVYAFPGMQEEEEVGYHLLCEDGSLAIDEGLHACCNRNEELEIEGGPREYEYCILCRHKFPIGDYDENCASKCNGTLLNSKLPCKDCVCNVLLEPIKKVEEEEEVIIDEEEDRYHACPHMRKMRGKK